MIPPYKTFADTARRTARAVWRTFAPRHCLCCGTRLSLPEEYICTGCRLLMTATRTDDIDRLRLRQVCATRVPLAGIITLYRLTKVTDPSLPDPGLLVKDGKFGNRPQIFRLLGQMTAQEGMARQPRLLADIDCLVPVPLHPAKRLVRGFNQTQWLTEGITSVCPIAVADAVQRLPDKAMQKHGAVRRRRDAWQANRFMAKHMPVLEGKHVAIVDDIITTGATVTACAEALLAANPGIRAVSFVAVFQTARQF